KGPETVCGLVRNIGREGQSARVLTLAELEDTPVDMFTTVYIGMNGTWTGPRMLFTWWALAPAMFFI
ncbi:hypothetical protein ACSTB0_13450, partial [Faecalibacterium wellingii]